MFKTEPWLTSTCLLQLVPSFSFHGTKVRPEACCYSTGLTFLSDLEKRCCAWLSTTQHQESFLFFTWFVFVSCKVIGWCLHLENKRKHFKTMLDPMWEPYASAQCIVPSENGYAGSARLGHWVHPTGIAFVGLQRVIYLRSEHQATGTCRVLQADWPLPDVWRIYSAHVRWISSHSSSAPLAANWTLLEAMGLRIARVFHSVRSLKTTRQHWVQGNLFPLPWRSSVDSHNPFLSSRLTFCWRSWCVLRQIKSLGKSLDTWPVMLRGAGNEWSSDPSFEPWNDQHLKLRPPVLSQSAASRRSRTCATLTFVVTKVFVNHWVRN